jgi:aprataxin
MSPKVKVPSSSTPTIPQKPHASQLNPTSGIFGRRNGLGAYLKDPGSYNKNTVLYYNADFAAINDLFPKSSVHTLLLPRNDDRNLKHPFDAFEDAAFLESVKVEVEKLKGHVAEELRRRYGRFSAQERERELAMDADPPPDELPAGRDWLKSVKSGVHAHPSMNHLHVHVMSVDRISECLTNKTHYNSFNTPFLVNVDDFPLAQDDDRRKDGPLREWLKGDMQCWRCGRDFGNKFVNMKEHLLEEFEAWKKE